MIVAVPELICRVCGDPPGVQTILAPAVADSQPGRTVNALDAAPETLSVESLGVSV